MQTLLMLKNTKLIQSLSLLDSIWFGLVCFFHICSKKARFVLEILLVLKILSNNKKRSKSHYFNYTTKIRLNNSKHIRKYFVSKYEIIR